MENHHFIGLFLLITISIQGTLTAKDAMPEWVPDGFELVYKQNFNKPDSIDQFVFTSPGDWKIVQVDDRTALEQNKNGEEYEPPVNSPKNIGMIDHFQFGSFILDFYVQQSGRKYDHRDACVFFNIEDPSNFYYVHIGAQRDDVAYQIHKVDDNPRTAITRNPDEEGGHNWESRKWHHVRLIRNAQKGHIAFYINNMKEPAMVARDTTHRMGYIGFGSFDDQARFTNIRIWAPEVQKQASSFFQSKK